MGLYECDEKKTGEVIKLLKELSDKYVPIKDEDVYEPVFFGGILTEVLICFVLFSGWKQLFKDILGALMMNLFGGIWKKGTFELMEKTLINDVMFHNVEQYH